MTPEQLAARWLADVRRHYDDNAERLILEADAIAHLARHLAPGDDLVAQATAALEGVTDGPWEDDETGSLFARKDLVCIVTNNKANDYGQDLTDAECEANLSFIAFARQWVPEAAARIAALTAERDEWRKAYHDTHDLFAQSDEDAASLRARLARMEGAAKRVLDAPFDTIEEHDAVTELRAALTDGGSNG